MKRMISVILLSSAIWAVCADEPQECVINDRKVVVVDQDEYAMLTGRLEVVWRSLNSTADGRKKLHGAIVQTVIDEANLRKLEYHRDGYIHSEPIVKKERKPHPKPKALKKAKVRPRGFTDAHYQMRQQLSERGEGKTVTVEHDAATGKDTVLEGK